MELPSREQSQYLLTVGYRVPQNIIEHSIQVNRVAMFLAGKLEEKGEEVRKELVDRASILHDMLKIVEIPTGNIFIPKNSNQTNVISKKDRMKWIELKRKYGGLSHEVAAYRVLQEKYPELAQVVRKHGYHEMEGVNSLDNWEEKLVCYADKRVKHDKIVSLQERFRDGHERYKDNRYYDQYSSEKIKEIDDKFYGLEREIFNKLDFGPEELVERLEAEENGR
ncbi:MAG: HD domain-containing protein [Nanobdellota archaeon]